MRDADGGTGILGRYDAILNACVSEPDGATLSEITARTGLSKATAARLIKALVRVGYLVQTRRGHAYLLGSQLLRLLHMGTKTGPLGALLEPIVRGLAEEVHETALIAKLVGGEVRPVLRVNPEYAWQSHVETYEVLAPHASASAKCIYAFQPPEFVSTYLDRPLAAYTENTKTDAKLISQEFAQIRARGFAENRQEVGADTASFACPIHLPGVGVIYSVAVVGPYRRVFELDRPALLARLAGTANSIASVLTSYDGHSVSLRDNVMGPLP